MYSSSSGLSYIVGPAWDTADGAMETTIQIEAQMLAVNRLILGEDSQRLNKYSILPLQKSIRPLPA